MMKKNFRRFIKGVAAITILAAVTSMSAFAASNWVSNEYVKSKSHEAAEVYRELGYSDDSAAIKLNQAIWRWANEGKELGTSYFYDGVTKKKYYLGVPTYTGCGYQDNDSYYDGEHEWFYDQSSGRYFRHDRYGNKIYYAGSGSPYSTSTTTSTTVKASQIDASGAWTVGANPSNYGYTYKNVPLYAGRIYGIRGFNESEVEKLAKLIHTYAMDQDVLHRSAFAWSVLDLKGKDSMDLVIQKYEAYDPNMWVDYDILEFAREMFFRKLAEDSGNSYVGRTLPHGYGYVRNDGYGHLYLSENQNSEAYTFPNAYSTSKSKYHSPY